jgi:hypothetical protein
MEALDLAASKNDQWLCSEIGNLLIKATKLLEGMS